MRKLFALFALLASALVLAPGAAADDTECTGTLAPMTYDNVVVPPGATCIMTGVTVLGNVKALENSRLHINTSNVRGSVVGDKADTVQVNGGRVRENIIIKEGGPATSVPPGFNTCLGGNPCEALVFMATVEEGGILIQKMEGTVVVSSSGVLNPISTLFNPIGGNLQVKENDAGTNGVVAVTNNRVAQNMQVEDNFVRRVFAPPVSFIHGLTVISNTVGENLQVYKNRGPGTKLVSNNTVRESLQCFDNDLPFIGMPNVAREAQGQCSAAALP